MQPFLRYAAVTDHLPNRYFTRAYDARILFVLSGKGEMRLETKTLPLCTNSLCYYPAGTAYYPCSAEGADKLRFVTLNFDLTRDWETQTKTLRPVSLADFSPEKSQPSHERTEFPSLAHPIFLPDATFLRDIATEIAEEFYRGDPVSTGKAHALLAYLLYSVAGSTLRRGLTAWERVRKYLSDNVAHIRTCGEAAQALGYNLNYLNRMCRKNSGLPLHEYLMRIRLSAAAQLLLSTQDAVEDVAEACAFCNAKHFSVAFRARYGVSPSVYRKKGAQI